MGYARVILCVGVCLMLLMGCSVQQPPARQIAPFAFVDQHGEPFGSEDLLGSVWIANFIFTNCDTVCPLMIREMAALQQVLKEQGIQAELVSFTVDPEVDTPEVLQDYIRSFTDDQSNWHLLTGYTQEEIESFAREQFQTIVQKPKSSTQVIHGTNFYLVDGQGYIRGEYNFVDESYVQKLLEDIRKMGASF